MYIEAAPRNNTRWLFADFSPIHARRKFFDALKVSSQAKGASIGIKYIQKLYAIENELRESKPKLSDDDFVLKRKEKAMPVLDEFKAWLDKHYITTKAETLL
ncbi:hypothetical protein FACS1894137_18250 [Spirochaetia bacterium]|nr:hypothetical protein FACS1894137_18250 [Spirochaetia bacterium]